MSTKFTLLYGENFHIFFDYDDMDRLPRLKIKGEEIELPEDLAKALDDLIKLHQCVKHTIKLTNKIDKMDQGLFSFNLKTGEKGEIKPQE